MRITTRIARPLVWIYCAGREMIEAQSAGWGGKRWMAGAVLGLLATAMTAAPSQALPTRALADPTTDPTTRTLVLPGAEIPGDWELVDEQSLKAGDQQVELYHELQTDRTGRIVGLAVTRFDDAAAATASLGNTIVQAQNAGQPGSPLDNLGDGPAVAFLYRVAEAPLRQRFGFDPDALGETVMARVDRYILTVQVGGPASILPDTETLASQLSQLQISHVRDALAAAGP